MLSVPELMLEFSDQGRQPAALPGGRPRSTNLREVVNALWYQESAQGCVWLPPAAETVDCGKNHRRAAVAARAKTRNAGPTPALPNPQQQHPPHAETTDQPQPLSTIPTPTSRLNRLVGTPQFGKLWPGEWAVGSHAAKMLKIDLAAGIYDTDDSGRVYDFQALRGQFISDVGRAGASLVNAQKLARYGDPKLTSNNDTNLSIPDLNDAVSRLAAIPA